MEHSYLFIFLFPFTFFHSISAYSQNQEIKIGSDLVYLGSSFVNIHFCNPSIITFSYPEDTVKVRSTGQESDSYSKLIEQQLNNIDLKNGVEKSRTEYIKEFNDKCDSLLNGPVAKICLSVIQGKRKAYYDSGFNNEMPIMEFKEKIGISYDTTTYNLNEIGMKDGQDVVIRKNAMIGDLVLNKDTIIIFDKKINYPAIKVISCHDPVNSYCYVRILQKWYSDENSNILSKTEGIAILTTELKWTEEQGGTTELVTEEILWIKL